MKKDNWISTDERLPEIDFESPWNNDNAISKDVWTWGEFGANRGRYFHKAEIWTINGASSSNGIIISHWMPLPEPPNSK